MPDSYDVIVYGTVCLDAIWRVERLPPPGGYAPIREEKKMIGGEAANTAIALTRWGVRVALVGTAMGEDEEGRLLRSLFTQDAPDLDLRFVPTLPEARTPFCLCIATPDGHRTMFGRGFSDMQAPVLEKALARSARFFTMDPNAWEAGIKACTVAAEAGLFIVAMDYTRVAEVNRAAAISVTSTDHIGERPPEELQAFAADLRDAYGATAIVTQGEKGCYVAERGSAQGEVVSIPAYPAPVMVDSTGAGDVFRAGLIYGQWRGWDMARVTRFASAAAALNCGAMGGWGGVQSVEEIEMFQRATDG